MKCRGLRTRGLALAVLVALPLALAAPPSAAATLPTRIHLAGLPASVLINSPVRITGSVSPLSSTAVVLERLVAGSWKPLQHTEPSAAGTFGFALKAAKSVSSWQLRVVRANSGTVRAGRSVTVRLRSVKTRFIVRATAAAQVADGQPVVVRGSVSPAAAGSVSLQLLVGKIWHTMVTAKLSYGVSYQLSSRASSGTQRVRVVRGATAKTAQGTSKTLTVTVARPPLTITTTALPAGTARLPYSAALAASGGTPPYAWSAASMPAGLVITPAGLISGVVADVGASSLTVTAIDAAGQYQTVALSLQMTLSSAAGNTVQSWGGNSYGQLGDGDIGGDAAITTPVAGLSGATAVVGGDRNGYGMLFDGSVWSWGFGTAGELGNGTTTLVADVPTRVTGLPRVTAIAANNGSGYGLAADGTVWAWGFNSSGQLGNGTTTDSAVPVKVIGLTNVVAIEAPSAGLTGYALRADGTVWAWGGNSRGQLGNGSNQPSSVPVQVLGLTSVTAIAAGTFTGYALKADGTVWGWGLNHRGELCNGTVADSAVPVQVGGLAGVTAIAGGGSSGYALLTDGSIADWGQDDSGQLGNNSLLDTGAGPHVSVFGVSTAVHIAAGANAAYAVLADGTVHSWGNNSDSELGNGTITASLLPVPVTGLSHVAALAAGSVSAYALVTP